MVFSRAKIKSYAQILCKTVFFLGISLFIVQATAFAGNQKEEALSDTVRVALSNAITDAPPPKPQFDTAASQEHYAQWLADMSSRLKKRMTDVRRRTEFLQTVWYESARAGLAPALVLGVIQVESAFRQYVISHAMARGYMQVMPFWARAVGDGDERKLFHLQTNLRYGCAILKMYIEQEKGDLFMALGRYNGSRGRQTYPQAVFHAQAQWE